MPNSFKTYFEESNYYNDTLHPQFWDEFEYYVEHGHSIVDDQKGKAA